VDRPGLWKRGPDQPPASAAPVPPAPSLDRWPGFP
jgi:hypothetical protein